MPRFDPIYTNFSAGEVSPLVYGRVDMEKYNSGCEIMENFIPRPHGPAIRRGGTRYIGKAKYSDRVARLIPFDTGATTGLYHLEFGDFYIRFFTQDGQLEDPPGTPYEIATIYPQGAVINIWYLQDANTLYLFHPAYPPQQLVRNDTYNWVISNISFVGQPPEWGASNWPATGAFHEQRLFVSGCQGNPGQIWASETGNYFTFTLGTQDDSAFTYVVYTEKINDFKWLSSGGNILAGGATGGEFKISSTDFNEPITPTNIRIVRQTNYGSDLVDPIRIGTDILFIQKGRLKLRRFRYSLERDNYISEDITLLSEHILNPRARESEYSNEPDSIAWFIRVDGQLIGVAYEPEIDIVGWFRLVTQGEFLSLSITDGWDDTRVDDIYVLVERTILGAAARYIEKLEPPLDVDDGEFVEDAFYVDSGLSYDGVPITVVAGLDHLEGETVQILADGTVQPEQVVTSGQITLSTPASKIHVGLGFSSKLKTLRSEGGNPIGTGQGKIKRIHRAQVRILDTCGISINGENLELPSPAVLKSEDVDIPIDDGYEEAGQIEIVQDNPLPATIIAIMPEIRTQ